MGNTAIGFHQHGVPICPRGSWQEANQTPGRVASLIRSGRECQPCISRLSLCSFPEAHIEASFPGKEKGHISGGKKKNHSHLKNNQALAAHKTSAACRPLDAATTRRRVKTGNSGAVVSSFWVSTHVTPREEKVVSQDGGTSTLPGDEPRPRAQTKDGGADRAQRAHSAEPAAGWEDALQPRRERGLRLPEGSAVPSRTPRRPPCAGNAR